MYNIFFDLSDFVFLLLLYSSFQNQHLFVFWVFFSPNPPIHGHKSNLTWMLNIAFVVFTTTQKLHFTL